MHACMQTLNVLCVCHYIADRQVGSLNRQLEDEKGKTAHLKREMENFKKKAKAEQEKAARMVREMDIT